MQIHAKPLRLISWLFALSAATLARADTQFELTWSAFDASGARLVGGPWQLDDAAGQPDSGILELSSFVIWGGFMPPLNPTLQILGPNTATWQVEHPAQITWKADKAISGNYVRFELWRRSAKLAVLGTATVTGNVQTTTLRVPVLPVGPLYSLRMVSTRLESLGNPNPWVETAPVLTLVQPSAINPRAWAIYE